MPAAVLIGALLVLWQALVRLLALPAWLLPAPTDVLDAFVSAGPTLVWHAAATLQETLLGLAAALVTGVGVAVAMDRQPFLRRGLFPVLVTSQTIPVVAIAPLLVIWLGYGPLPKVIVVTLVCFFPIAVATFDGLGAVDPDAVRLVRSMGASGWQLFWRVRWPGALPSLFSGVRIGATYGVIGAIVSEWVGGSRGLGFYMVSMADQLLTARVFAAIAVSSLLSILLFGAVTLWQRLAIPWQRPSR